MSGQIDVAQVKAVLRERGIYLPDEDLDEIITSIDVNALREQARRRIKVEEWKGEPVNGVDLRSHPNPVVRRQVNEVLSRGGKIYKVYIDGRLVVLQYHKPFSPGLEPITESEYSQVVEQHVNHLVDTMTFWEVVAQATVKARDRLAELFRKIKQVTA